MNDLKESHETIKQKTDELKQRQDNLQKIIDTINNERNDWVTIQQNIYAFSCFSMLSFIFLRLKNLMLIIWRKKFVIYKIYL